MLILYLLIQITRQVPARSCGQQLLLRLRILQITIQLLLVYSRDLLLLLLFSILLCSRLARACLLAHRTLDNLLVVLLV